MMRIQNPTVLPPGGWPYTQPETGWRVPDAMSSFSNVVSAIVEHRRGNRLPGADVETASIDLHSYTCTRLGNDPTYCADGIVVSSGPAQKKTLFGAIGAVGAGLFQTVKHAPAGISIIGEWLGDGANPVAQNLAQARSDICTGRLTGNKCPKNETGWSFPMAVVQRFHEWIEQKKKLNLKVEGEDNLHTCSGCTCNLPLKVWIPFHHINKHTSDATFQKLDPRCWMLKERKESEVQ